ncbi:hypothetical protein B0H12DRAFT_1186923 [Mycena haematopus]|nr:hypothetical protein B0H12DRAFT_1186923 [Mycena haematopus]
MTRMHRGADSDARMFGASLVPRNFLERILRSSLRRFAFIHLPPLCTPCLMNNIHPSVVCLVILAAFGSAFAAGPAPVLLGAAGDFAILAKAGVSTVPNSLVTGDVGVSPVSDTSLTGFSLVEDASGQFSTSTQVDGRLMGATDALPTPVLLTLAVLDMQTAFTDAMNRPLPDFVEFQAGLIGGSILVPGLYKWTTDVTIATGITIAGGPADTWIFQISGSLDQAVGVQITLIGGALSQNIIWAVAGPVTVGATAVFEGNVLAKTNVVIGTNAIDNGCIYAQTAVSLEEATVACTGGSAVPPPSSSAASSTVTSAPVSSTSTTPTSTSTTATFSAACTPTAAPCFSVAFQNLNASIHGDDFLTFILTDTVEECIITCACDASVCGFANGTSTTTRIRRS